MLIVSLALAGLALQQPEARSEPSIDLATLLVTARERYRLPALGGAVVTAEGVVALAAIGQRSNRVPAVALSDDLWHLGSCTKAMTATLAARLVERGVIDWNTTVGEVFGEDLATLDLGWDRVTLELLLGHRAGATADLDSDGLWERLVASRAEPRAQRRELVEAVLSRPPANPPGSQFLYSNAGYAIAGAMLESVSDTPWEQLMRREVFEPLGMTSAGFGAPGSAGKLDQPLGHHAPTEPDGAATPQLPGPEADNPPAIGPAGNVHASLADWGRFIQAHLVGARGEGAYLRPQTWERLHHPLEGQDYGYGWISTQREWAGGMALTHSGSNTLWYCTAWLAPQRGFAVLVTTNIGGERAVAGCDAAASSLIQAWQTRREGSGR